MSIFNRTGLQPPTSPRSTASGEALDTCIKLGVDLNPDHTDALTTADLVRLAYREGVRATEQRLMSADAADAIAVAIETPEMVVTEPAYVSGTKPRLRWQVVAVQQAAVYGVPK